MTNFVAREYSMEEIRNRRFLWKIRGEVNPGPRALSRGRSDRHGSREIGLKNGIER
jgi:hypothetical protein